MSRDPRREVREPVARLDLETEGFGILVLAARPLEVHDHFTSDGESGLRTEVFLDHREREVDARGYPGARIETIILVEQCVAIDRERREAALEVVDVRPVRRHAP